MAYKFQVGAARMSGSLVQEGDLTLSGSMELQSGESLVIGNASLTEAELEQIDGITAGTVAASKAVVVDSNKDITGLRNVTATGYFEIGSAQLTESEMEMLDGITAGTVAASKAVVVDASKDASGFRNVTGTGAITAGTSFIIGSADLNEADMEQIDGITAGTVAASKALVVDSNKDISGLRNVTATGYFEIGSAQLTEAEMEQLDGITAGTVAASKAVVVDANKDIASFRHLTAAGAVTAGTSFIIGSADLNEADLEKLDGITNGAAAASKAVVLDASKDIAGLNDVSAAGLTLSDLTDERLMLVGASGLLQDNAAFGYNDTRNPAQGGYLSLFVSSSASGSSYLQDGMMGVYGDDSGLLFRVRKASQGGVRSDVNVDINSTLDVSGQADMAAINADGAVDFSSTLNVDGLSTMAAINADGAIDFSSTLNVDGLSTMAAITADGAIDFSSTVTMSGLGTSTVALGTDLMIINDGAGGVIKNTSLADYSTAIAGAGLLSTAGILAVVNNANGGINVAANAISIDFNDLSAAAVNVAADSFAFLDADGNVTQKESIADLVSAMAGAGLTATNGQLSTQSGVVALIADSGTLVEGYNYLADLTANATVSLPASPSVGDVVHVKAGALANDSNVIINKQGSHVIDDDLTSIRIESAFGAVSLVYVVANEWRLV